MGCGESFRSFAPAKLDAILWSGDPATNRWAVSCGPYGTKQRGRYRAWLDKAMPLRSDQAVCPARTIRNATGSLRMSFWATLPAQKAAVPDLP